MRIASRTSCGAPTEAREKEPTTSGSVLPAIRQAIAHASAGERVVSSPRIVSEAALRSSAIDGKVAQWCSISTRFAAMENASNEMSARQSKYTAIDSGERALPLPAVR